ncbi:ragulator complex protein LAMTOR2-like protein [Chlamydoabsidia padenii]|nr:ragulator complex protein LAMTOR2-like protein [Chlamydoabsidia padenii]
MLKPKVISQVLRQSTHKGVKASLLMTQDGSLLSFATDNDKNVKIYAAIAANIWSTYQKQTVTETFLDGGESAPPKFLLLDCEEGSAFITSVGTMLLCLVAEKSVPLGILKAKAEALQAHLEEPLLRVAAYQD